MNRLQQCMATLVTAQSLIAGCAWGAGTLEVQAGWIRPAPPGAAMLAGYARLHNGTTAPLRVTAVESARFQGVSIHETTLAEGVSRMRELAELRIDAGATVILEPGAKHLMLMGPSAPVQAGSTVRVVFVLDDGSRIPADFTVADRAPAAAGEHDHAGHAHHP